MSEAEVLACLSSLRQHQRAGQRSPHKPLLVLFALSRLTATGSSALAWPSVVDEAVGDGAVVDSAGCGDDVFAGVASVAAGASGSGRVGGGVLHGFDVAGVYLIQAAVAPWLKVGRTVRLSARC